MGIEGSLPGDKAAEVKNAWKYSSNNRMLSCRGA
jgi:hypothetical protein